MYFFQIKCDICNVQFFRPKHYQDHNKEFHGTESQFRCPVCFDHFLTEDWLQHLKSCSRNANVLDDIYCKTCDTFFADKRILNIHLSYHDPTRRYSCSVCFFRYTNDKCLQQHYQVHTTLNLYEKCPFCPSIMGSKQIQNHIRTHTGEKPLQCGVCGLRLNTINRLSLHLKMHRKRERGSNTNFRCSECGLRFKSPDLVRNHISQIHLNRLPHKCDACDRSFATPDQVTLHYRESHLESSDYFHCPYTKCQFKAKNFGILGDHINVHTKTRPFQCDSCDFASGHISYLNLHKISHHSKA